MAIFNQTPYNQTTISGLGDTPTVISGSNVPNPRIASPLYFSQTTTSGSGGSGVTYPTIGQLYPYI